ncbi:MAG: hypothetical protein HPY53_00545 [Brevinematales bacterium]|nr:hypothetical protein [Brevinematales bacterium]
MDPSFLAKKYVESLKNNKIDADSIIKLPKLVTCGDWKKVEIVNSVDYAHDVPAVHYKGLLVKHQGGLYYMSQKVTDELGKIDRRFSKSYPAVSVIKR